VLVSGTTIGPGEDACEGGWTNGSRDSGCGYGNGNGYGNRWEHTACDRAQGKRGSRLWLPPEWTAAITRAALLR